jgi:CRISPR/Cas system endoribonuclease Cas6 (RAMP superfamily)
MLAVVSKPSPISQQSLLPSWAQEGSTATLFLHNMSKPRHGQLYLNDGQWYFCFGNSKDFEKGVQLLDFLNQYQSLLDTGQLFRGHTKFARIYQACHQAQLHDCIL